MEPEWALYRALDEEEPLPEDQPPAHWCDVAAWYVISGRSVLQAENVFDATRRLAGDRNGEREGVTQARLLRCVLGYHFRPMPVDPRWLTSPVLILAQQMYDARDFAPLPILADALEEAGCDDADVLAHCRGSGPHVRGCWVVDLILGKS